MGMGWRWLLYTISILIGFLFASITISYSKIVTDAQDNETIDKLRTASGLEANMRTGRVG
jgi:hypothetical protein